MRFRDACKLHNGDHVLEKKSGDVLKVVAVHIHQRVDGAPEPYVGLDVISDTEGYLELTHRQVT